MAIDVVGGTYKEYCVHPRWNDIFGSAGRAALAIATLGTPTKLHSYMNGTAKQVMQEKAAWLPELTLNATDVDGLVGFTYLHDLAVPDVHGLDRTHPAISVRGEQVVRFGMLEGDAVVDAEWAVYDPQNTQDCQPFRANGSKAEKLALVLNAWEAGQLAGKPGAHPSVSAPAIAELNAAQVVVVKMGPEGALVWTKDRITQVPAYRTDKVWKIGSGDCFVAHFANAWMHERLAADEAAKAASQATAYYCQNQGLPTKAELQSVEFSPIVVSPSLRENAPPMVYLAGPFFDLSQIWMIEQARSNLATMGLQVFSPFHDIGLGTAGDVVAKDLEAIDRCKVLFAVTDGLDAGTVYEIGYARAKGIPVVVYSERHSGTESLKMMEGSGCVICSDYTTSIYSALWEAVKE